MELSPGKDEAKLPSSQAAVKHHQLVDTDPGAPIGMIGVEMGVTMILEVH
jgi:hypothetical protein